MVSYHAIDAHKQATRRRRAASVRPRIDEATWAIVERHLREELSPEQIVGCALAAVSHERIYQRVLA
jgi:IS30 family transposase